MKYFHKYDPVLLGKLVNRKLVWVEGYVIAYDGSGILCRVWGQKQKQTFSFDRVKHQYQASDPICGF